jgi:hypothetical protein
MTAPPPSPKPQAPASKPLPVKTDTGMNALLAVNPITRFLPEDFKLGVLAAPGDLEGTENDALGAAASFLAALARGKASADLLSPEAAPGLLKSLSFALEQGNVPTSYRLGKPKKKGSGEIAFNVRLFSAEGAAEGEIYVSSVDDKWLVSDVQVSLVQLSEKREKPKDKFFPSSYQWLLGG